MKSVLLLGVLALGLSATACSDPCGDLEAQCGDCSGTDPASVGVETACKILVDADDSDACDAALDSGAYKCP